jgi:hypothetical protein
MAVRPVLSVVNTHAHPNIAAAPSAPTALPAEKTVTPVVNTAPARNEPRRAEHTGDSRTHDAIIDPETSEVVYRTLDARTRQVIHQIPDQAQLRMQAYARAQAARALADGESPAISAQTVIQKVDAIV